MLMTREQAKLFQKTLVRDEFGGSKEVLNYIKDIYGRAVPATEIYSNENNKIQVETDMKFISEERLTGSVDVVSTTYMEDLLAPYQEVLQSYINASSGRLVCL